MTGFFSCSYGPRESDRREAFSTEGRLQCDVKIASFARRERKGFGQAGSLPNLHHWNVTASKPACARSQLHVYGGSEENSRYWLILPQDYNRECLITCIFGNSNLIQ